MKFLVDAFDAKTKKMGLTSTEIEIDLKVL